MSWRETRRPALLVVAALMLASCQVRPLYAPEASEAGAPARLAAVQIKPVTTREAQQVRNQLVFLLNGGAGEPDQAPHAVNAVVALRILFDIPHKAPGVRSPITRRSASLSGSLMKRCASPVPAGKPMHMPGLSFCRPASVSTVGSPSST